jgi:arginyl-tRNA--protein-N-Asp/Glu arginylyltransferase
METLFRYIATPSRCGYLPDRSWSLEYELVSALTAREYKDRMVAGWRRFGAMLFRPRCRGCTACRPIRVEVDRFRPDRSQRRARKVNEGQVELRVGEPSVTPAKLLLYDRYHAFQAGAKGWPQHPAHDADAYASSFVDNPFPTQEWCYYVGGRLAGVGYVDDLPGAMSAIYFFYDPAQRHRSLGTWNVLRLIEAAAARGVPHLYLGYYVAGCPSMAYKKQFMPNQVLGPDGAWA